MTQLKIAAIVVVGSIVATAPAVAGMASPTGLQLVRLSSQIEQSRYRRSVLPERLSAE
jgi:hypothetical protein